MINKLLFTALLSIIVQGQGAVSVPQEVPRTSTAEDHTTCPAPKTRSAVSPVQSPFSEPPQNPDTALSRLFGVAVCRSVLGLFYASFRRGFVVGVIVPSSTVKASRFRETWIRLRLSNLESKERNEKEHRERAN
ncbi:hypothetical protein DFH08DRAFT_978258 [Mycena albidolilacea]|uniref:Uncharacterized protein n=1 Tax=Mycena albidolilacea TaxID=1033008 RepID=A0AAD6YZ39_9AGAR|nr:hypothetical protein DFH08DRAFT_978258 [Mycena albidolilacea]